MYGAFVNSIEKYKLIKEDELVVAGVSGGRDSMVMLSLLLKYKEEVNFNLIVCHVNHMVRGVKANRDEEFVKKFCKDNNLEFYVKRKNIDDLSKELKTSSETAGRKLRYDFFESFKPDKIAVAHNKDDQAETVLMRIINGTGIKGLAGIKRVNGIIIRPVIDFSRDEITQYAKDNNILYVDDHTNYENIYLRNKIRNDLIPKIEEEYNSKFKDSLVRLSEIANETSSSLELVVDNIYREITVEKKDRIMIDLDKFNDFDYGIKSQIIRRAYERIKGNLIGFKKINVDEIIDLIILQSGKEYNISDIKVYRSFNYLIFTKINEIKNYSYKLKIGKTYIKELDKNILVEETSEDIFDDKFSYFTNINPENLIIRNRLDGDRIYLKSLDGNKKVKEIFRERKIPVFLRNNFPILVYNNKILWIFGIMKSEFSINGKKTIYKITMEE